MFATHKLWRSEQVDMHKTRLTCRPTVSYEAHKPEINYYYPMRFIAVAIATVS